MNLPRRTARVLLGVLAMYVASAASVASAQTGPTFGFGGATIPDQTYFVGGAITTSPFPNANFGNVGVFYTLTPDVGTVLPGLSGAPGYRLYGTPTMATDAITLTLTARDANGDNVDTLTFSVTVLDPPVRIRSGHPNRLTVFEGGTRAYSVRVTSKPSGDVVVTPSVAQDGHDLTLTPSALTFTSANWNTTQSVTVAAAVDDDSIEETATISHAVSGFFGSVTARSVIVFIRGDSIPTFIGVAPPDQTYIVGEPITRLDLPAWVGGNGSYRFVFTPPLATAVPGLRFTDKCPGSRFFFCLSGTPSVVADAVTLTYSIVDREGDTDTLTFSVTVQDRPIRISPTTLTVPEGDSRAYSVALPSAPSGEVTVTLSVAPEGHDLTLSRNGVPLFPSGADPPATAALTFTSANWNIAQRVSVTAAEDGDSDNDIATISHAASGSGSFADRSFIVTVTDNDPDTDPDFSAAVAPGDQTYFAGVAITDLTLPPATGGNGAVTYALAPDVAGAVPGLTFDTDTRVLSGTPSAAASAVTLTYTASDADADADTATLTFSVTVLPPAVRISPTTLTVTEGGSRTYSVVLTTDPGGAVTVTPTSDNTAAVPTPDALTFAVGAWNVVQTVSVFAAEDVVENFADETATISHAVVGYDAAPTPDDVVVTVDDTDQDTPPTFAATQPDQTYTVGDAVALTLPLATGGNGTITYALAPDLTAIVSGLSFDDNTRVLSGTADMLTPAITLTYTAADSDINTAAADTASLTFAVTINPVVLQIAPTALTIDESAIGGGTNDIYTVKLNAQPASDVTVTPIIAATNHDLTLTFDSAALLDGANPAVTGALTFTTANWNDAQTVTVTAAADDDDATDDTVTITHTATGTSAGIAAVDVVVTVTDEDIAHTTAPDFAASESVDDQTYTVNAQIPDLTLPMVTPNTGDGDITYTLTPTSDIPTGLSFDDTTRVLSGTPTTATTTAVTLTYTAADSDINTTAADTDSLTFTVTVNPAVAPAVVFMPSALTVTEGTSTGAYAVELSVAPDGGGVTVTPSVSGGGLTFAPAALTFTDSNWNTAQNITITAAPDDDAADETLTVSHAVAGAGNYDALTAGGDVTVTVTDTSTPAVTISTDTLTVNEGESDVYTVRLATIPTANVVITPTPTATATLSPTGALTFTATDWNDEQTVTVTGVADADAVANVDATISHAATSTDTDYAAITPIDDVTVTVTETDSVGFTVTPPTIALTEGNSASYTVVLTSAPSVGAVTVTPDSPDSDAVSVFSGTDELTFTSANWNVAQTVSVIAEEDNDANDEMVLIGNTVTVSDSSSDYNNETAAGVTVSVTDPTAPDTVPTFGAATVDDQNYTAGVQIPDLTLPEATGGNGAPRYTLTPDIDTAIPGLTFDDSTRVVSGMPDAATTAVTLTYTAADSDGNNADTDTASLTFAITVVPAPTLVFASTALSVDEGGTGTYGIELSVAPTTGNVVVTPSATGLTLAPATLTFTATSWDTAQSVVITAARDDDTVNETIAVSHAVAGTGNYTGLATAGGGDFTVTVTDTSIPAVTIAPLDLTVDEGDDGAYTVQLATEPAAGAQVMVTPTVEGDLASHGVSITPNTVLVFDSTDWNTAQSVVVAAADDDLDFADSTATITHAVTGYTGVTNVDNVVVTVDDDDTDSAPAFATGASVPAQSYTENTQIPDLLLPAVAPAPATQGNGDITYALTPIPSGLNFDATNRVLSGTPDAVTAATTTTLTYTAADEDGNTAASDTDSLLFTVTVSPAAPVTPAALVFAQTAVSVDEGATGGYTVELSVAPDSGNVTVTPDATTGLTFAPAALTFTATSWDTAQSVTITATRDADTANETLTVSHAVAGAGNYAALTAGGDVTVTVTDTSIPAVTIAPTDLTVDEGVDGAYTVQLATEPATGAQVMVTPTVEGDLASHGVSITPNTVLVFDSTDWNTAQSVVVSAADDDLDFADSTATISHAVAGYTGVTGAADVVVTVDDNDTDTAPAFASGASVPAQSYTENAQIPALVLPEVAPAPATQGNGDITYMLTPLPSGLNFDATNRVLSGTPNAVTAATTTTLTYTAADEDGNTDVTDTASLLFTVTINPAAPVVVTLRLEPDALTIDEAAAAVAGSVYTVRLSSQPASDVTVTPSIAATDHDLTLTFDGAALLGAALTFVTAEWNDAQTVTVTAAADDDITDDTVTITHAATGTSASIAAAEVVVTVDDTSTPGIMLDPDALTVAENAGDTYTIRLNTIPLGDATITLTNTGAAHADVAPLTLTFAPGNWNVVQSVTVSGIEDEDAAAPAAFEITHRPTNYGSNAPFSEVVRVTVTETDTRGVTIAPTALPVDEGGNNFYTVALTSEPVGTVMVTPDASAGAFSGITITPTTALMFDSGNWNTAQTVSVFAGEDNGNFDDDTLTITHAVSGYDSVTSADNVVVTVDDNDTAPVTPAVTIAPPTLTIAEGAMDTYTVTLTTNPGGAVTVTPTSDNIADVPTPAALTFAAAEWNTPQTVTVNANADVLEDFTDENAEITHVVAGYSGVTTVPAVAVTVTDPHTDTVPSFAATQTDQAYTVGETVDLTLPAATPGNGAPRYTLTPDIATAIDGLAFNANTRIVSGTPNAVTTAAVTLTYTAADSDTNNADTDTASLTFTITVNPATPVTPAGVTISTPTLTVNEGGDGNYTVRLDTIPSGSVTITPTIPSNTDLTGNPSALTFTAMNWNAVQTVTLTAAEDDDAVDDAPVVITHTVEGADYGSNNITAANVTATITENDDVGITVAPTDLNIDEGGASGTYTVVLTSAPSVGNVTVMRDNGDPANKLGFGSSPASLLFTAANWNMPQTVSVGGATDSDDTDDVATITHMVTVSDVMSDYDGATAAPVTVNVNDTGRDELRINPTTLTINEDGSGIYTIRLSSNTTGGAVAVVTPMSADTAIATVFPTTPITFASGTWATERTITVRGVADADFDNETVTITHTVTGYNAPPAVVTVTVLDTTPADTAPAFVSGVPVPDQTYTAGTQIATLTLPEVDSNNPGNGAPVYTLTPQADIPGGLNFDDTARTLSGTPNAVAAATTVTLTYTVADSDGVSGAADEDSLTFTITVNPATPVTPAGVTISTPTLTVTEGGDGNYTVVLDTQPSADVMITPSVTPATASVSPTGALTFTAGNWNDEQTVTVTGVADADATDNTPAVVSHASTSTDTDYDTLTNIDSVTVTITEAQTRGVTFTPPNVAVGEGGDATYTVELDSEPTGNVTVTLSVSGDVADHGVTITTDTTLTFDDSNWDTPQDVSVAAAEDDADFAHETATISHAVDGADYATTNADDVVVTVTDDDSDSAPRFAAGTTQTDETYTAGMQITDLVLPEVDPNNAGNGAVTYALAPLPSGLVFTANTRTLSGTPNAVSTATTTTLTYTAADEDDITGAGDEASLTFTVTVNPAAPAVVVTLRLEPSALTVDEGAAAGVGAGDFYTVRLSSQPASDVTVTPSIAAASHDLTLTYDGAALLGAALTFVAAEWNDAQTVTVTAAADADITDDTVTITHAATGTSASIADADVTVTVTDDDMPARGVTLAGTPVNVAEGSSAEYTVVLDAQPSGNVTVTPASGDSAVATVSGALTFSDSNWDTAQTVTVTGADDDNGVTDTTTITHTVAGADYAGVSVAADPVTVTVTDTDTPRVVVSDATLTVNEGEDDTYTVRLDTQPSGEVTITPSSDNAVATVSGALTFTTTNWNDAQSVTVTGTADDDATANAGAVISHAATGADADYNALASIDSVTVTVDETNMRGVTLSGAPVSVTEGLSAEYTVVLTSAPDGGNVTVTPSIPSNTDLSLISSGALTFDANNWNIAQPVSLTAAHDDDAVADDDITITHTVAGADYGSNNITAADVTATITEDDSVGVTVSPRTVAVDEMATDTYTVVLTSAPSVGEVTVTASSADTGAVAIDISTVALVFDAGNWNMPQTISVGGVEDNDADDESVVITNAVTVSDASSDYASQIGSAATVTVTVDDNDTASVTVSAATLSIDEDGDGTYTIELTSAPSGGGDATVTPVSADPTIATVSGALVFGLTNWNTAQNVVVTGVADGDVDNEMVSITHTVNGYTATAAAVAVTVTDTSMRGVTLSGTPVSVTEGSTGNYTVVLDTQPTGSVTVTPDSDDDTIATVSGALTFTTTNWNDMQTVTVTGTQDDDLADESTSITHAVTGADYATNNIGAANVAVTVNDDETAGVTISDATLAIDEGSSSGAANTYTVELTTMPTGAVVVSLSIDNSDVTADATTLNFTTGNWNTEQTVTISATEDPDGNHDTAAITHTVSGGGYDGASITNAVVTVTVTDNDPLGIMLSATTLSVGENGTANYTVELATEPNGNVTITPTSGDPGAATVSAALTFTDSNWNTAQQVVVTGVADDDATDENFNITHAASGSADYAAVDLTAETVAVTVTDNNTRDITLSGTIPVTVAEGATANYGVVLDTQPTGDVTVTPSSDTPAVATVSAALVFGPTNWNTVQNIVVTGVEDANTETDNASITHAVTGADYATVTVTDVAVTVTDNDMPGITISTATLTIGEDTSSGAGNTYTVVLNTEPSGDVTVMLDSNNDDVTTNAATLNFGAGNWNTPQDVIVSAAEDDDATDDSASITHTVSGANYAGAAISNNPVAVTVTDNETRGVTISPASLGITEESPGFYTVALTSAPDGGDVTVTPTSGDAAATVTGALTFTATAGNWNTAQTVIVTATTDPDTENETATITHRVDGADYGGVTADDVVVTVTDNDTPGVTISPTTLTVDEGEDDTYTVRLATLPNGNVTVTPMSGNAAATVSPTGGLTFGTGNWNAVQAVTVFGAQDDDAADGIATITHMVEGANYAGVTARSVAVTITDDEDVSVAISDSTVTVTEGATGAYTVTLTSEPVGGAVTVTPSIPTGTDLTLSPVTGGLTFTAGNWNVAQMVALAAAEDADAVDDAVVITHAATGADYDAAPADDVAVTIDDNDNVGVTVTPDALAVNENEFATYTVELTSAPSIGEVTVTPRSADVGAVSVTAALVFAAANWNIAQVVSVGGVADADATDESVEITNTVAVSDGASEYAAALADEVTVTVNDADEPGVAISTATLSVAEDGNNTYTVVLNTQPTGDVAVALSIDNSDVTAAATTLNFGIGNWNTMQNVVISAAQDPDGNDDIASITHTVSGADYNGATITNAVVAVTVDDDDMLGITLSVTALSVTEEGATANYTVELDTEPDGNVTITPMSGDIGAATVSAALIFTDSNWNTAQQVVVTGVDDFDATNETVTITHAATGSADYAAVDLTAETVMVTVTDDDPRGITLSGVVPVTVTEGETANYGVVLDTQPTGDVTVTPDSGDDAVATVSDALVFTPANWNTAQSVTVTGTQDADSEDDSASITHAVTGADYATVTVTDVAVTVTDNDTPGVTISTATLTIGEGTSSGAGNTYNVVLNTEPSGDVTVMLSSDNGDVTPNPATLNFGAGNWNTAQNVIVSAAEDPDATDDSADITHTVSGANYAGATISPNAVVTVTVTDSDIRSVTITPPTLALTEGDSPTYSVALTSAPDGGDVTVTPTIPAGADVRLDPSGAFVFDASNWSVAQTRSVVAEQDEDAVTDADVTITHAVTGADYESNNVTAGNLTVMIAEDDSVGLTINAVSPFEVDEGGASMFYTVVLDAAPSVGEVTVTPTNPDTDAVSVSGALVFDASNWNTSQRVMVSGVADDDAVDETVVITNRVTVSDSSSDYMGQTAPSVTVTVTDPGTAAVTVAPTTLSVPENGNNTYTIVLTSAPSGGGNAMVTPSSADTNVATVTPTGALVFTVADWNVMQTVTVTGVADIDADNEMVNITHTVSGYDSIATAATVAVTVTDTSVRGLTLTGTPVTVTEGANITYAVVLNTQPSGNVTVTPASGDTAVATVSGTLVFSDSNWNTAQNITVTGIADANTEADTTTITHTVSGADYAGVSVSADPVMVTVNDSDSPGVTISKATLDIDEGSDSGTDNTYTVVLTTEPSGTVTVMLSSDNPDVTPDATMLLFGISNWNTMRDVIISAEEDPDGNNDTANIMHAVSGANYGSAAINPNPVVVTVTDDEVAGVRIDPLTLNISEGRSGFYTVELATAPGGTATVVASVTGAGHDLTLSPSAGTALTFTDSNWNVARTVSVAAGVDNDTTNETHMITHTVTGYTGAITAPAVTVNADERLAFGVAQTTYSVAESGGMVSVCVDALSGPPAARFVAGGVRLNSNNGTATAGADYTAVRDHLLTFSSVGQECVDISVTDDNFDENDETFTVSVTLAPDTRAMDSTIVVDPDLTTVTITDDDTRGVTVALPSGGDSLPEGSGTGIYTVVLTSAPDGGNVVLTPSSSNGDVTFRGVSTLNFSATNWNVVQTVRLDVGEDDDSSNDSAVISHMVSGADYGSVTVADLSITITDNDTPAVILSETGSLALGEGDTSEYTVVLRTLPAGNVVVTPASDDAAVTVSPSPLTFTPDNWDTPQRVVITAAQDDDGTDATATITHAVSGYGSVTSADQDPIVVTVTDDDMRRVNLSGVPVTVLEGATVAYGVVLNTQPSGDVMVTPDSGDDDVATVSGVLVFTTMNWNTAQSVVVTGVEDSNAVTDNTSITHAVTGADYATVTAADVTVTVTDNDTPGVTVSATTLAIAEGSSSGTANTYTVVLNTEPEGAVVVALSSDNRDVTTNATSLNFTVDNWNTPQDVVVSAAADADAANDTAAITHTVSGANYNGAPITPDTVTVTVTDNDTAGVTIAPPMLATGEGTSSGVNNTYTVVLDTLPSGNVAVALSSDNPDVRVNRTTLNFNTGNWNTPQQVIVTVAEDSDSADESAEITHTATGAAEYAGIDIAPVVVTVTDNDTPAVVLSQTTPLALNEGETREYTVVLRTEPTGSVMVTPTSSDPAVTVSPSPLIFTGDNWNITQRVIITAIQDANGADALASITHTVSNYGSVTSADQDPIVVTVTDDDRPGITISRSALVVDEAGEAMAYNVALTAAPTSGSVTVTPSITPSDHDLTLTPNTALVFTDMNWNTAQEVRVSAATDADGDNDVATIRHSVSGADFAGVVVDSVVVTVTDDDSPGVTISETSLSVAESGGAETYTVALNTAPSGNATVTPTSNTAAALVSPSEPLTFTPANWSTAQTVTVTGGDIIGANDITGNITHAVSGYGNITTADAVAVTVRAAGIVLRDREGVEVTRLNLDEGNSMTYYTVVLDTLPAANVTVTPLSSATAVTVSGALVFTPANWNTAQTVDVTATASATIRHAVSATGNYAGLVGPELRVVFGSAEAMDALNDVILPEVAHVMVGNHISAITHRITQARTPTGRAGAGLRANLGGHSTLEELAATHAQTMVDGGLDTKTLLADSDFAMPLNAGGGDGLGGANLALWGSGDYRNIGGDSNNVDWDGSLFSAHLGVDVALQPGLLAGVMLAWSEADLEYTNRNTATATAGATTGDYELDMTSLHPYLGWRALNGRLDLWTTVGYGSGDLKITEANATPATADATLQTLGIGGSGTLLASRDTELRVKGEVQATRLEVGQAKDDAFNEMGVSATQTRLALEATRTLTAPNGAQILPSLELGMRYDGGDGATGNGLEIGAGLRYHNATRGLTLETRLRALLSHSGDTKDQGLSATLNLTPGADRQGLSLTLTPAYGNASSGVQNLWNKGVPTTADSDLNARMSVEVGYGFAGFADGLLTPYSEMTFDDDNKTYRMGMRWNLGKTFTLNLANERLEKDDAVAEDVYLLEGEVKF